MGKQFEVLCREPVSLALQQHFSVSRGRLDLRSFSAAPVLDEMDRTTQDVVVAFAMDVTDGAAFKAAMGGDGQGHGLLLQQTIRDIMITDMWMLRTVQVFTVSVRAKVRDSSKRSHGLKKRVRTVASQGNGQGGDVASRPPGR